MDRACVRDQAPAQPVRADDLRSVQPDWDLPCGVLLQGIGARGGVRMSCPATLIVLVPDCTGRFVQRQYPCILEAYHDEPHLSHLRWGIDYSKPVNEKREEPS